MSGAEQKAESVQVRDALSDHFLMLRELTMEGGPPHEWHCQCGLKFGFSDSALGHVAQEVERVVAKRVRAAYADAVQASNDLHLLHPNTTGCWGGIGGSAMTPECAMDCPNPKHEKAQMAWRDICRQAQGERVIPPGQQP